MEESFQLYSDMNEKLHEWLIVTTLMEIYYL